MTDTALAPSNGADLTSKVQELALIQGDLKGLSPQERVQYYMAVCTSLGLNPLTKPFEYIDLRGLKLYATRNCTDQLAGIHKVNLAILAETFGQDGKLYIVKVRAQMPNGRYTDSTGVVSLAGLAGENLANALMKAETKAKRRAVLSLCGLSFMDETEAETVKDARRVQVDHATGDIIDSTPSNLLNAEQMTAIRQLARGRGEHVLALCKSEFADKVPSQLTVEEADRFIVMLEDIDAQEPQTTE